MKEPYEEGIANRLGPASCAGDGNIAGVAGTGVHAGQPSNSEITVPACRPCPDMGKATRATTLLGESSRDAAESETLSMCGTFQHGNRETPETPSPATAGTVGEGDLPKSDMHVSGESDDLVVPGKRANKAGTPVAESVEERGSTKGNGIQAATCRTQRRIPCVVLSGWRTASRSHVPKVGAVWGSASRTDLCGGWPERAIPTATTNINKGSTPLVHTPF
jgi:hypothetical protein